VTYCESGISQLIEGSVPSFFDISSNGRLAPSPSWCIEQHHKQELLVMIDQLKILVRVSLGDESADAKVDPFVAERRESHMGDQDDAYKVTDWFELSQEERNRRIAEGRAAYYGKQGQAREAASL
jgi:hypothetical protein